MKFGNLEIIFYKSLNMQLCNAHLGFRNKCFRTRYYKRFAFIFGIPFVVFYYAREPKRLKKEK